jgi:hypothetical protein
MFEHFDLVIANLNIAHRNMLFAFLQRNRQLLLITSARIPTTEFLVGPKTVPRFVDELDVDEIIILLTNQERIDPSLEAFLVTRKGHDRIRALRHFIGGLPQHWTHLARSLTPTKLLTLTDIVTDFVHQLTPSFRAGLETLPPAKAKLLLTLAKLNGGAPTTVSQLAGNVGSTNQTTAKLLGELEKTGHVTATKIDGQDQRFTFYEPANRLLVHSTICQPTTATETLVTLVRNWYDTDLITIGQSLAPGRRANTISHHTNNEELNQLIARYNTACDDKRHNSPTENTITVMNQIAAIRDNPACDRVLRTAITDALWEYSRKVLRTWNNEDFPAECERDLAQLHESARPDITACMLHDHSIDTVWINISLKLGYQAHLGAILHGLSNNPARFTTAIKWISIHLYDIDQPLRHIIDAIAATITGDRSAIALLPIELRRLAEQLLQQLLDQS